MSPFVALETGLPRHKRGAALVPLEKCQRFMLGAGGTRVASGSLIMKASHCTFALVVALSMPASALAQNAPPSEEVRDTHKALQITTASSMVLTMSLGTLLALNKPTLLSDGLCMSGDGIFGEYGCGGGLSVLHGLSAVVTVILYTATTTLEIDRFDWPHKGHGDGYAAATWGHLVGVSLLPIVGIITVMPDVLGIEAAEDSTFKRVLRTLHLVVGYGTVGTYIATVAIDLS